MPVVRPRGMRPRRFQRRGDQLFESPSYLQQRIELASGASARGFERLQRLNAYISPPETPDRDGDCDSSVDTLNSGGTPAGAEVPSRLILSAVSLS